MGPVALLGQWERTAFTLGPGVDDVPYRAIEDTSRHGVATIDRFVVRWILVAVDLSFLCRSPARRLKCVFVGAYVTLSVVGAIVVAIVVVAIGGTA